MGSEASTLTLLFTDLVSSTELLDRLGDDAAVELFADHLRLLRATASEHLGQEVKSLGDGLMVTFSSAAAGLAAAIEMQRRVADRNAADGGQPMGLRIGINAGEVVAAENDYFGTPVVLAKRLCDRADPGQTLVSEVVRALVGSRGGHRFLDHGTLSLKGFSDPVRAFALDWQDRPPDDGLDAAGADGDPAAPGPALRDTAQLALPAPLVAEARPQIVGRVEELGALIAELERARSGDLRVALIGGEPGIGKTRLAAELCEVALARGCAVLYGRCDPESIVPFQPFVQALAEYVAVTPDDRLAAELGSNVSVLSRLLPELAGRFPGSPASPPSGSAETDRYVLFAAIASLLAAQSERNPLVLVLDDLHWADQPTLALLRVLTLKSGPAKMLLLGAYRDREVARDHPLAELIAQRHRGAPLSIVKLHGLSETEVEALITSWGGQPAPAGFAHGVWQETEGQPFFVRELLRHLLETGAIFEREGHLSPSDTIAKIGVPEGVRNLIESRLARLSEETQRVLAIASVIGREFGVDVLERVTEVRSDHLLELLEEATSAGLIDAGSSSFNAYAFSHALVRETLYDELTAPRRVRLHRRVGDALEELASGSSLQRLPELAHHYFAAAAGTEELSKAISYAVDAAVHASEQFAYEDAAQHYERALNGLALRGGDDRHRCELLLSLGTSRWSAGEYVQAKEAFRLAASLAEELGLSRELARAALGYGGPMAFRAGVQDTVLIALLERALAALPNEDSALRAMVTGHLGTALSFVPLSASQDRERGVRLGSQAVAMARRLGDKAVLAEVLNNTVVVRSDPAQLEEQLAASREAVALADEVGAAIPRAESRVWLVAHLMASGEMAAADDEYQRLEALVDELRQPYFVWLAEILGAMRALHEGRVEEGDQLAWKALETGQKAQNASSIELFAGQILMTRTVQGRLIELHAASAAITDHFVALPAFRCARAALCCSLGLEDEARADLEALAVDGFRRLPRDMFWLTSIDLLAEACASLGDRAHASELYELLEPFAERNVILGAVAAPRGVAARALGVLASTVGRYPEAEEHFEAALRGNRRIGCVPGVVQSQLDYAHMLLVRGHSEDAQRAKKLAEDALATAQETGMHGLARIGLAIIDQANGGAPPEHVRAQRRRRFGEVAQQLTADTKAALSVRGRGHLARMFGDSSDEELERRFGSAFAQRAMMTTLARSFQPRMAFGFEGEIQIELLHTGEKGKSRPTEWWTIKIAGEKATARRRIAADPAVVMHVAIPDFVRIVSGVANPVTVWFENHVQIEGDVILGARMVELFGGVAPFEVLDEVPAS